MRTMPALLGGIVVVALLSGCSVPAEWAARLNADGSVDFLECWGPMSRIEVDYHRDDDDWDAEADWLVVPGADAPESAIDVAYYGEVPDGWLVERAEHRPPQDWTYLTTNAGYAVRDELVEGEWVWFTNDADWAWIPPRPCDGWELGPDGEPRRLS